MKRGPTTILYPSGQPRAVRMTMSQLPLYEATFAVGGRWPLGLYPGRFGLLSLSYLFQLSATLSRPFLGSVLFAPEPVNARFPSCLRIRLRCILCNLRDDYKNPMAAGPEGDGGIHANRVIDDFVEEYDQLEYYYKKLAEAAEEICKNQLDTVVPSYISKRVKTRESLLRKLVKRKDDPLKRHEKLYRDKQHIRDDIKDIVGIRISLYFPNSAAEVDKMIRRTFKLVGVTKHPKQERLLRRNNTNLAQIEEEMRSSQSSSGPWVDAPEQFRGDVVERAENPPDRSLRSSAHSSYHSSEHGAAEVKPEYQNQFSGYTARHYKVRLKEPFSGSFRGYKADIFEIQVVSALAHVWSEVEHDLVYKVLENPSEDQKRMLDSLNGLVKTGELILEQIQQLSAKPAFSAAPLEVFTNKYQLGDYLENKIPDCVVRRGSRSMLYKTLQALSLARRSVLDKELENLSFNDPHNTNRLQIVNRFQPFEPSQSICIIASIFLGLTDEELDNAMRNAIGEIGDVKYKCKVTLSSLIWMQELFKWSNRVEVTRQVLLHFKDWRSSLNWALGSIMPTNILLGRPARQEDQEKIEEMWHVFENSTTPVFQFVFKLSRNGVWRQLPDDLSQLEGLRANIKAWEKVTQPKC